MSQTRKFSLTYIAAEDRIAWDAEDMEGKVTRIWITQRFCREFVAAIVARLPKPPGQAAPEATAQGWAQAAAMSNFGKTPGVQVRADDRASLVRAVRISPAPQGLTLDFDLGADPKPHIELSPPAARQMLSVLYDLHLAAGWPTGFWPAWILGPKDREGATALN